MKDRYHLKIKSSCIHTCVHAQVWIRFAEYIFISYAYCLITVCETVSFLRICPVRLSDQNRETSVKLHSRARATLHMTVNYKNWATVRTRIRVMFFFFLKLLYSSTYASRTRAIIANADVCSRFTGPWPVFLSTMRDLNSRHHMKSKLTDRDTIWSLVNKEDYM